MRHRIILGVGIIAASIAPSGAALAGVMDIPVALCDVAIAPTKCVAAIAAAVGGCAVANFEGPFGGVYNAELCVNGVAAAATSAVIHIPIGQHGDFARSDAEVDSCTYSFTNVLGSSGCGAKATATGCGQTASAHASVTNFNTITTPDVSASTKPCPVNPNDPPTIDPCRPTCRGVCDLMDGMSGTQSDWPGLPQDLPPVGIGIGQLCSSESQASEPRALGDLPVETQTELRTAFGRAFQDRVEALTSDWPKDNLHELMRDILVSQASEAGDLLPDETEVTAGSPIG